MTAQTPFWHEAAPPEGPPDAPPPAEADVVVAGAGFTGLAAALCLARAGRSVAVLDAGPPGAGASTRNGGMIGWGHRARLATLAKRHGETAARAILAEAAASLAFTKTLIGELGDVGLRPAGRFLGAAAPVHFERLAAWARDEAPALDMRVEVVPESGQDRHIATATYRGGLFFPDHAALNPALFHRRLLDAARAAGATVTGHHAVTALRGGPGAWQVEHPAGAIRAREVIFAANGYHGGRRGPFAALAARLMPIPSYVIATGPLGENRVRALLPGGASIVDTRSVHSYFRPDPEGRRIVWGGRASLLPIPPELATRRLRAHMLSVFPEIADAEITHSWTGNVAFTGDGVPHLGRIGGVWHACGYNGSGVAMAPYLGWRVAEAVMGREAAPAFASVPFPRTPFAARLPGAVRAVEAWHRFRERLEGVRPIPRA